MSQPITLEISKRNLIFNCTQIRKLIGKSKFCAVVKGDGYGHGIVNVANVVYPFVDCYAVALYVEAVKLIIGGIDKDILMLLPPTTENVIDAVGRRIILTVGSFKDLKVVLYGAEKSGVKARVHLAVNSGMNRLGLGSEKEIERAIKFISANCDKIGLEGVFSHFSNAEDEEYTERQFEKFTALTENISGVIKHISSSGGVLYGGRYNLDMVRIGIMLYGYTPYESEKIKLKPVMTAKIEKVLTRRGIKGERLMYGDYKATKNNVSILRLGYADGLSRTLFPSENNLCMDLCAVDDKIIKGKNKLIIKNVLPLSRQCGTIPYEILTSLSKRARIILTE